MKWRSSDKQSRYIEAAGFCNHQTGYLTLILVVIIASLSVLGVGVAYLFTTNTLATTQHLLSSQAVYLAEAGVEGGIWDYKNDTIICDGNFTSAVSLSPGEFRQRCLQYTVTSSTLSQDISNANTIIPLSSLSGYSDMGRIKIDSETIDYSGVSSKSSICGIETCGGANCLAPCLVGAERGGGASSHTSSTTVSQDHVVIEAQGAVPSFSNTKAKHTTSRAVHKTTGGTGSYKVVGEDDLEVLHYDGSSWNSVSIPQIGDLYTISCVSDDDCWAGGEIGDQYFHWDGSSWSVTTASNHIGDIYSIDCIATDDCWAGGYDTTELMHWDGASWSLFTVTSVYGFYAVECIRTDFCWAAGEIGNQFLRWNGSTWSLVTTSTHIGDINAIDCVDENFCVAGGIDDTEMLHWNGSSWQLVTSPDVGDIYTVSCVDENFCFAAGEIGDEFIQWNGTNWTLVTSSTHITDINTLACSSTDNCWAAGELHGTMLQWDGTTWNSVSTTSINDYRGIAVDGIGGSSFTVLGWQAVFP